MNDGKNRIRFDRSFVVIDYQTLMSEKLTAYELAVYCILCGYASSTDNSCFPSYQTLAKKAGCSRCTAIRAIARLEEMGLVEKENQKSKAGSAKSNLYTIRTANSRNRDRKEEEKEPEVVTPSDHPSIPEQPPMVSHSDHPSIAEQPPVVSDSDHPGIPERHELDLSNQIQRNQNHSIYPSGEEKRLKEEIEYFYFEQEMPEKMPLIDCLVSVILSLRKENAPEHRRLLEAMDSCIIQEFLEELKDKDMSGVRNTSAWLRRVFLEYLKKRAALLASLS